MFLIAVVGGLGSVLGPLLGATLSWALPLLNIPVISDSGIPILALVLLLFYPSGLSGLAYAARDMFLRRVAIRNRIDVPSLLRGYAADRRHSRAPLAPRRQAAGGDLARYPITRQWGIVPATSEGGGDR
jgi:hypothetical protein